MGEREKGRKSERGSGSVRVWACMFASARAPLPPNHTLVIPYHGMLCALRRARCAGQSFRAARTCTAALKSGGRASKMAATARSCPPSLSVHSPLLACVPLSTKETGVSVSFVESGTEGWKRKRDGKGEAREGAGGVGERSRVTNATIASGPALFGLRTDLSPLRERGEIERK